jgi:hypothetical protein
MSRRSAGINEARTAIIAYFEEVKVAGLELPDGWFGGQRMDNYHQLTFAADRPGRLIVELDEHLLLTFSGDVHARRNRTDPGDELGTNELILERFSQLVLDQRKYGSDEWDAKIYRAGAVRFAAWIQ